MIHFEWPWIFLLLPLPWLCRVLLPPFKQNRQAALRVPFLKDFADLKGAAEVDKTSRIRLFLAILAWVLLILATARPQWLGEAVNVPVSGRDLMLAVDLSQSMEQVDFQYQGQVINRLDASKMIVGEFVDRRLGDRLGLILFGERAYLQTPLTFDRKTVKTLLDESALGLAGRATAIGDAIGLAVKRLRADKADRQKLVDGEDTDITKDKVLILVTDGANTAGEMDPLQAADLAAHEGLRIYTVGIGADEMLVRSLFGARNINPSADLDEKTLTAIADKTGGLYFRARNTEQLRQIYTLLDELEPVEDDPQQYRPRMDLFPWPAGIALLLAGALLL